MKIIDTLVAQLLTERQRLKADLAKVEDAIHRLRGSGPAPLRPARRHSSAAKTAPTAFQIGLTADLVQNGPSRNADVAARLGLHQATAASRFHLARKHGLVAYDADGRYVATPLGADLVRSESAATGPIPATSEPQASPDINGTTHATA